MSIGSKSFFEENYYGFLYGITMSLQKLATLLENKTSSAPNFIFLNEKNELASVDF